MGKKDTVRLSPNNNEVGTCRVYLGNPKCYLTYFKTTKKKAMKLASKVAKGCELYPVMLIDQKGKFQ